MNQTIVVFYFSETQQAAQFDYSMHQSSRRLQVMQSENVILFKYPLNTSHVLIFDFFLLHYSSFMILARYELRIYG